MRSVGVCFGALLLALAHWLPGWADQPPAYAPPARYHASLELDGSKSMRGFQAAGSVNLVVAGFQASARAVALAEATSGGRAELTHQVFAFVSPSPQPSRLIREPYRAGDGLDHFRGDYTLLPEAFDRVPAGCHFVFFLTDNLDNHGTAGGGLVQRLRQPDVAAVFAMPLSLSFSGDLYPQDLAACCAPPDLASLIGRQRQRHGWFDSRRIPHHGPRGLILYLVVRDGGDDERNRELARLTAGLLRELGRQPVFLTRDPAGELRGLPLVPLKSFASGLRADLLEVQPQRSEPLDLSQRETVYLQTQRLILPDFLPGVTVRDQPPANGGRELVGVWPDPRVERMPPEAEHARWLKERERPSCALVGRCDGQRPDELGMAVRVGPYDREDIGLWDWDHFRWLLSGESRVPITLVLELHPRLHRAALATAPEVRASLTADRGCDPEKVCFPAGQDFLQVQAADDYLKLHHEWRITVLGRPPFWGWDTAGFVAVWFVLPGVVLLLVVVVPWLALRSHDIEYAISSRPEEPDRSTRAGGTLRPSQGHRLSLRSNRGEAVGQLSLGLFGCRPTFHPAGGVEHGDGKTGPVLLKQGESLGIKVPRESGETVTQTGRNNACNHYELWFWKA